MDVVTTGVDFREQHRLRLGPDKRRCVHTLETGRAKMLPNRLDMPAAIVYADRQLLEKTEERGHRTWERSEST